MTDSQIKVIKRALLDVELMEIEVLEKLPSADFEPSKKYTERVNKLISLEQKRENSFLKLSLKRKISILVASILILLFALTACIFNNQIKDFIIELFDTSIKFFIPDSEEVAYQEYVFSYIPDEYTLKEEFKYPRATFTIYSNNEYLLQLEQREAASSSTQIDTNSASYTTINIGDYLVYYNNKNNTHVLVWKNESNIFSIVCDDYLTMEELEKIVLGIAIKE